MISTILRFVGASVLAALFFAAPATAQSTKTVYFKNDCSLPMYFSARFVTPFGNTATSDLRVIQPGETIEAVKTKESAYSFAAYDRHREWFGDTIRDVYMPQQDIYVPLPFRAKTITEDVETVSISCKSSYGEDAQIQPRVFSGCNDRGPIWVAMRYMAVDGEWKTFAWRKIEGREIASLPASWNTVVYIFARLKAKSDGSYQSWGGKDAEYEIDGETYGFAKHTLSDGKFLKLRC